MKILQINTSVNSGSTGRIAEDIGKVLIANNHESHIAYGRGNKSSVSQLIIIGSDWDIYIHGLMTLLFDRHGFGSKQATIRLVKEITKINPDVIGLHNIHGYYLNIEILFEFLLKSNKPVVWTLHDCWPFTGHCSYYDSIACEKWKTQCHHCPKKKNYPSSYLFDESKNNYTKKKQIFNSISNINFITPSHWLAAELKCSFLKNHNIRVIHNGIDLDLFRPISSDLDKKFNILQKKVILGVASIWDNRKGMNDFLELGASLPSNYQIVLIGLNEMQIRSMPHEIIGISRTENIKELAAWYSLADVFVNPTTQDNFPTTNIEALACGTPVITYNTGGSPEAIDEHTGRVVNKGDIEELKGAIHEFSQMNREQLVHRCRQRAINIFEKDKLFLDYVGIYEKLVENSKK